MDFMVGDEVTIIRPEAWANANAHLRVKSISGDHAELDVITSFSVGISVYRPTGGPITIKLQDLALMNKGVITNRGIYRKGKVYSSGARS